MCLCCKKIHVNRIKITCKWLRIFKSDSNSVFFKPEIRWSLETMSRISLSRAKKPVLSKERLKQGGG